MLRPVYEKRRQIAKSIPSFWPVALMNHSMFAYHAQHNADKTALSYLEDVWVEKDPLEHRCFTIEFVSLESSSLMLNLIVVVVFQRKPIFLRPGSEKSLQVCTSS